MQHLDHASAVRCGAIPRRADQIRVRGDVIDAAPEQDAAVLQLPVGQLRIVAEQQHGYFVRQRVRHAQPRRAELALEGVRSADVVKRVVIGFFQIVDRRVRRGQKVLRRSLDPEPRQLCDVGVGAARGIVRQKKIPPAAFSHMAQKIERAVKKSLAEIDRAVHVEQEQPFFR